MDAQPPNGFWNGTASVSPRRMFSDMPRTRLVWKVYLAALLLFVCFEVALHKVAPAISTAWFRLSEHLGELIGKIVPAIGQMRAYLANTPGEDRLPFVTNTISIMFIISMAAFICGAVAVSVDFRFAATLKAVTKRLNNADRDPGLMLIGYIVFTLLAGFVATTRIGYVQIFNAYAYDAGIMVVAFEWYVLTTNGLLVVAMMFLLRRKSRLGSNM